ncbi:DUF1003 domain-containing protein [Deinococcus radiodurans]|nr:hypothetical protein A2G07_13490 [Deinococcus radiodurans R1 = ATCC 13939 = DSM 20539]QIP30588.1 DUF1003 domain-containing protein [Deinococcus radiodurans]QIP33498.1 DUF1003 domain-containing protein [Deinococcus radiodurans]
MSTDPAQLEGLLRENAEINRLLREQAELGLTQLHRPIEQLGVLLSRPAVVVTAFVLFLLWIVLNLDIKVITHKPWDEPPFFWLQGLIGLLSLITTVTVLISQARQAQLAEQRAQLQLQIVLLTEQRSAKIIALLEELRRDLPNVRDRPDPEAEALKQASDPEAILEALQTLEEGGPTSLPAREDG